MSKHAQDDHAALRSYLSTLFAHARETLLVELRFRSSAGMRQSFEPAHRVDQLASEVSSLAARTDVYVGVLPRWRPGGARGDVAGTPSVLWVDCDGPEAATALEAFRPQPAMVIASGSEGHRHAYWPLRRGQTLATIERSNRRLAWALGGDLASSDGARILRPPGTLNHKHAPPTDVRMVRFDPDRRYGVRELVGVLPDPPTELIPNRSRPRRPAPRAQGDQLRSIPPAVYVERLTGQAVPRHRKVACPLHDDSDPSLHVYAEPERGWFCFGCRRGGSIYDLAAALWGRSVRGRAFLELRTDLETLLR